MHSVEAEYHRQYFSVVTSQVMRLVSESWKPIKIIAFVTTKNILLTMQRLFRRGTSIVRIYKILYSNKVRTTQML